MHIYIYDHILYIHGHIYTYTGSEGNCTSRMANRFELTKGLHYIIGPAGELITAIRITLHQGPVQAIN